MLIRHQKGLTLGRRSIPTSTHQLAKKLGLSHNAIHLALRGKPGLSDATRRRILREAGKDDASRSKGSWIFICRSGTEKDPARIQLEALLQEHSLFAETLFTEDFSTIKMTTPADCHFYFGFGFENAALPLRNDLPSVAIGKPDGAFLRTELGCRIDFIDLPAANKSEGLDESHLESIAAFLVERQARPSLESRVLRLAKAGHSPPKKKATLADIARRSGVTANTVSRALHRKPDVGKDMVRRIFRNAHALGYTKIPPLREATVLVFKQIPSPQSGPFRIESWRLAELAEEEGVSLHVYEAISKPLSVDPDLPVLRESVSRIKPDAVLAFPFTRDFLTKTKKVAGPMGLPVISFQVSGIASGLDSVFIDNRIGIEKHLRFCLENGIQSEIGFVSTWRPEAFAEQERFAFFKECLASLGIARRPAWEILVSLEWDLRWPRPENRPAIYYDPHVLQKQIKKRISENVSGGMALPKAFLCYNDLAASLLYKSFLELGIPPPVIHGWDADAELLGAIETKVPTIDIPTDEMARSFVKLLLRRLRSPAAPELSLSFAGKFLSSIREKNRPS